MNSPNQVLLDNQSNISIMKPVYVSGGIQFVANYIGQYSKFG